MTRSERYIEDPFFISAGLVRKVPGKFRPVCIPCAWRTNQQHEEIRPTRPAETSNGIAAFRRFPKIRSAAPRARQAPRELPHCRPGGTGVRARELLAPPLGPPHDNPD